MSSSECQYSWKRKKKKKTNTKYHLGFLTENDCLDTRENYKKEAEGKKNKKCISI